MVKTWHIELAVVTAILVMVNLLYRNDTISWMTLGAVLLTFNYIQITDRLQEKQKWYATPQLKHITVECYWKLNWLLIGKELQWIIVFLCMQNYAAIAGAVLFALYPYWRLAYRKWIRPVIVLTKEDLESE